MNPSNETLIPGSAHEPVAVIPFKAALQGEVRRGRFDHVAGFDGLQRQIFELFQLPQDAKMELTYVDPDGDSIAFSTDAELNEAISLCPQLLRLQVQAAAAEPAPFAAQMPAPYDGSAAMVEFGPAHSQASKQAKANMMQQKAGLEQRRAHLHEQLAEQTTQITAEIAAVDASLAEAHAAHVQELRTESEAKGEGKSVCKNLNRRVALCSKKAMLELRLQDPDLKPEKRAKINDKLASVCVKIQALPPPSKAAVHQLEAKKAQLQGKLEKTQAKVQTRLDKLDYKRTMMQHKAMGKMANRWARTFGPTGSLAIMSVPNPFAPNAVAPPPHVESDDSETELLLMSPPPYAPVAATTSPKARFVKDVSVPDGQVLEPEQAFTKTWRMRNVGEAAWPEGTALVRVGKQSDSMGAPEMHVLPNPVHPGDECDVSVPMIAPLKAGRYVAYWRLQDSTGRKFGQRVWVEIQVAASSESTSAGEDCVVVGENAEAFETGLASLVAMGFTNEERNRKVLSRTKGNVTAAVEILVLREMPMKHAPARVH